MEVLNWLAIAIAVGICGSMVYRELRTASAALRRSRGEKRPR